MKFFLNLVLIILILSSINGQCQTIDTLIDAGGYKLHFRIIKGKGTPILFEAGGGEDARTWKDILKPIEDITGTTLITYDRTGFGKSTFNSSKHGILNGIKGLETALQKLGDTGNIILVAHSQGGLYATLYAARHPDKVKAAVLIDATTACFYEPTRLAATQKIIDKQNNDSIRVADPGSYYQGADFSANINLVRTVVFPKSIPVIDLVSDETPFSDKTEAEDWKKCHQEFAGMATNRTGIIAYGTGHFIFKDNPQLVINSVVKMYAETLDKANSEGVLKRALNFNINASNDTRKDEVAYRHSADDLNSWGNALLQKGVLQKALEIFRLNAGLHPDSWRAYDNYGNALLKNGNKEEAIKMYQKSIELNPKNEKGKKILEQISRH